MKQIDCKAGYKTIQADEGMTFIGADGSLMGELVHLGKGDKKKKYTEITLEEAAEIIRQNDIEEEGNGIVL